MIHIQQEFYSDTLREEIKPLLVQQWDEIANWKGRIKLNVDWSTYSRLSTEGKLVVLTARSDGELIGYSVFFLLRTPHYHDSLFALNDVLYIIPAHRRRNVGLDLIRRSEEACRQCGAVKISWHVKPSNHLAKLFIKLGYVKEEEILGRLL